MSFSSWDINFFVTPVFRESEAVSVGQISEKFERKNLCSFITTILEESFMIRYAPFWLKLETYNFIFSIHFYTNQEKRKRSIIRKQWIYKRWRFFRRFMFGANIFPTRLINETVFLLLEYSSPRGVKQKKHIKNMKFWPLNPYYKRSDWKT